jgi:hypothetical protein
MIQKAPIWLGCAAVVVLIGRPALGQRTAPVPAALEIEVLDPNADPVGNAAVELRPSRYGGGTLEVDIPPVVLVHRYYYTGNRSFQGPMLPGGPSIVVCHHPRSGDRVYIPVQLMPGAPMVRYTASGIEYDYGRHGIKIGFGIFGKPKVAYRNCTPATRMAKNLAVNTGERIVGAVNASRIPQAAEATGRLATNLSCAAQSLTETAVEIVTNPAIQLINATPLGSVLDKPPEDIPTRIRDRQVEAAAEQARREDAFIPTLR